MSTFNLVGTWAPLLGGTRAEDCLDPLSDTCVGGVASVAAYLRHYGEGEPSFVFPRLDRYTPFVQMHPLGWNVNRLILRDLMGWTAFASTPSIAYQASGQPNDGVQLQQDLSILQTQELPLVLTNVVIPPSNSWYSYTKAVLFDNQTGLALLSIADSDKILGVSQIDSAKGMLDFIATSNTDFGCLNAISSYSQFLNRSIAPENERCWIPIIYFADLKEKFDPFLQEIAHYRNPPALIIDIENNAPLFNTPQKVPGTNTWLVSYQMDAVTYYQHRITLKEDKSWPVNITLITDDLLNLPKTLQDDQYQSDMNFLRESNIAAQENNPVVGYSEEMPVQRVDNYRRCKAGECEIGNLFTDALRWRTKSDFAFITSGGIRGPGWPAGKVKVSNLWEALPFPNQLCSGAMSGISLFKLFNYSTSIATFQGDDTVLGGELLQVSGVRVTYNTQLNVSRVVALDIWNDTTKEYSPVDRLTIYTFATDNFLCSVNEPYPKLTGGDFLIAGEIPGVVADELHHAIVAAYLEDTTSPDAPYIPSIDGRLVNDTSVVVALNWLETKDSCGRNTYWETSKQTCLKCENSTKVHLSEQNFELQGESGTDTISSGHLFIFNEENFDVTVSYEPPPNWIVLSDARLNSTYPVDFFAPKEPVMLRAGASLPFNVSAIPLTLEPGTAVATIFFNVYKVGVRTCDGVGLSLDVLMRSTPPPQMNQLGSIRYVAWGFALFAILASVTFAVWVYKRRNIRVIKTLQPMFLILICFGVLVMASTIFPVSVDDGVASQRGCDIACMATPWLLSIGFTISFATLFSKLWRINKLFLGRQFRRLKVEEKDVLLPFAILFTLNFTILLSWTLVDPLQWSRKAVPGQPWNTYGVCRYSGSAGTVFLALTSTVNLGALAIASWQAFKARNISSEFSESKKLGAALFSWVQLALVGTPVLFLINDDNFAAKFFLKVALIFAVCMSVLVFIFVPIIFAVYGGLSGSINSFFHSFRQLPTTRRKGHNGSGTFRVHISGIETATSRTEDHRSVPLASSVGENFDVMKERDAPNPDITSDHDEATIQGSGNGLFHANDEENPGHFVNSTVDICLQEETASQKTNGEDD